ncbi:MAG: glycosyltransferase family 39 protein [Euryarchaeota archaeon]|nr:glycosyltransferase family 39 protein [Euryarchaeota archaeon]
MGRPSGDFRTDRVPILLAVTAAALVARLYFLADTHAEGGQDSYWLAGLAKGLIQGEFEISSRFATAVQPLYPLLMGLLGGPLGDLLLAGKVVALLAGVAAVPATYLLWREIEPKVALLASALVAFNYYSWYYSLHVFRDTLFLTFGTAALALLYRSRKDPSALPPMGAILGLATLTRGEGYFLAAAVLLTYILWTKAKPSKRGRRQALTALLLFAVISLGWQLYVYSATGELLPSRTLEETAVKGHLGLGWLGNLIDLTTLPLAILALGGVALSRRDAERHLPLYLYLVLFSVPHMWFHEGNPRYALPLLPILLGWSSMAVSAAGDRLPDRGHALSILVVLSSLAFSASLVAEAEARGDDYAVVRDAVEWLEANGGGGTLYAGDEFVYGYYTDRRIIGAPRMDGYIRPFINKVRYPFYSTIITEEVRYLVAHDSLNPWLYTATRNLGFNFTTHRLRIQYQKIIPLKPFDEITHKDKVRFEIYPPVERELAVEPLKVFERNNQTVVLYRVVY